MMLIILGMESYRENLCLIFRYLDKLFNIALKVFIGQISRKLTSKCNPSKQNQEQHDLEKGDIFLTVP